MNRPQKSYRAPTVEEFIQLRQRVGWGTPDETATEVSIRNALFSLCLEMEGRLIGLGRVVGDGGLYYYVQDLIVVPEHRQRGFSLLIMEELMGFIKAHAKPGAFIGLFAAQGVESYYQRLGFIKRPTAGCGPGMSIPYKELDEVLGKLKSMAGRPGHVQ